MEVELTKEELQDIALALELDRNKWSAMGQHQRAGRLAAVAAKIVAALDAATKSESGKQQQQ